MNHEPLPELWWIANGNTHEGEFSVEDICQRLRESNLMPHQLKRPVGGKEWKPQMEWPELFTGLSTAIPQDVARPSAPHIQRYSTTSKPSWNPIAITWLGFLFAPIWSGIMTAFNTHRLGLDLPH